MAKGNLYMCIYASFLECRHLYILDSLEIWNTLVYTGERGEHDTPAQGDSGRLEGVL
jgi:hypothetical protein